MLGDLKYNLRALLSAPSFFVTTVLTTGLGIAITAVMFSVLDAVVLQPLPYHDADRLVAISTVIQGRTLNISAADFSDVASQSDIFESCAYVKYWEANLTGLREPQVVTTAQVSGDLFSLFSLNAIVGALSPGLNNATYNQAVAVISYSFWKQQLQSDRSIVGRPFKLDDKSFMIVGVAPSALELFRKADIWIPVSVNTASSFGRGQRDVKAYGKLRSGISLKQAQTRVNQIADRLSHSFPATNALAGFTVRPLKDVVLGDIQSATVLLFGAVIFMFIVACLNVAHLLLSRSLKKQKETAIRIALGANRVRILWQLCGESLIVSSLGAFVGLLSAWMGIKTVKVMGTGMAPRLDTVSLNQHVVWLVILVSLLSALFFAFLPYAGVWRTESHRHLIQASLLRHPYFHVSNLRRRILLGVQISISVVLLAGAALMIKSARLASHASLGFNSTDVLTIRTCLPKYKYADESKISLFFDRLLDGLSTSPGIKAVALSSSIPLSGFSTQSDLVLDGKSDWESDSVNFQTVTPAFFDLLGLRILKGRRFLETDIASSRPVAIVNRAFVQRFWPDINALGKRVHGTWHSGNEWAEIIGVVSDTRDDRSKIDADPIIYLPSSQVIDRCMFLLATGRSSESLLSGVRAKMSELDKDQPMSDVDTMQHIVAMSLGDYSFLRLVLTGFATVSLVLATMGIYGVVSYWVGQNMKEIGIRIALGAQPTSILRLTVQSAMAVIAVGVVFGLIVAAAVVGLLSKFLYGLTPYDGVVFATSALTVILMGIFASYVPSRQALSIDPNVILRRE